MTRRLIPLPRGMSDGFYAFMSSGCVRTESGELMMLADELEQEMSMNDLLSLKYRLWNSDDVGSGYVAVDPLHVSAVVETERRRAYGGNHRVAVIHMVDGKEYVVEDDGRTVQLEIWNGKSFPT